MDSSSSNEGEKKSVQRFDPRESTRENSISNIDFEMQCSSDQMNIDTTKSERFENICYQEVQPMSFCQYQQYPGNNLVYYPYPEHNINNTNQNNPTHFNSFKRQKKVQNFSSFKKDYFKKNYLIHPKEIMLRAQNVYFIDIQFLGPNAPFEIALTGGKFIELGVVVHIIPNEVNNYSNNDHSHRYRREIIKSSLMPNSRICSSINYEEIFNRIPEKSVFVFRGKDKMKFLQLKFPGRDWEFRTFFGFFVQSISCPIHFPGGKCALDNVYNMLFAYRIHLNLIPTNLIKEFEIFEKNQRSKTNNSFF